MRILRALARLVVRLAQDPTVRDLATRALKRVGRWLLKKLSAVISRVAQQKPPARRNGAVVAFA